MRVDKFSARLYEVHDLFTEYRIRNLATELAQSTRAKSIAFALVLTCLLAGCTQSPDLPDWVYRWASPATALYLGEHGGLSFYSANSLEGDTCLLAIREDNTGGIECGSPPFSLELDNDTFVYSESELSQLRQVAENVFHHR